MDLRGAVSAAATLGEQDLSKARHISFEGETAVVAPECPLQRQSECPLLQRMCSPHSEDKQRLAKRGKVPALGTKGITVRREIGGKGL